MSSIQRCPRGILDARVKCLLVANRSCIQVSPIVRHPEVSNLARVVAMHWQRLYFLTSRDDIY
jgi:hypothetical protein